MFNPKMFRFLSVFLLLAGLTACSSSLVLNRVNFAQPVESVDMPNDNGMVKDRRYGLEFNIKPLQYAETQDSTSVTTREVRVIRSQSGFYFITAQNYKNVYVMSPKDGRLSLKKKILINEEGMEAPAFNQRAPYIELVERGSSDTYMLNKDGIVKGGDEQ